MVDLLIRHPPRLAAERSYTLGVVLGDWLGLSYAAAAHDRDETVVTVPGCAGELVLPDTFFAKAAAAWLEPASLAPSPLPRWRPESWPGGAVAEVPVLFGCPIRDDDYLRRDGERVELGIDVLGSVFFLLTCYEERVTASRDEHDRFPGAVSLARREGLLERPLADEYLELLWGLLRGLWPGIERRPRDYRVSLEHDVDVPFGVVGHGWPRVVRNAFGDLGRRRSPALAARRLRAKLAVDASTAARLDPNNTFGFLMAASEGHGLASTFFVKSAASDLRFDDPYSLDAPWVSALLAEIHARGHAIGLHPSYATYRDGARLKAEFCALRTACARLGVRQAAWGARQHYLRFAAPATWRHCAAAGLAYDASLGFADEPGFRCGTCHEFPVYDLEERRALPLRERPLTVMEVTLLSSTCLGLAPTAALERIARLAAICRRFSGCFRLLWHNSELLTPARRRFYAGVVAEAVG